MKKKRVMIGVGVICFILIVSIIGIKELKETSQMTDTEFLEELQSNENVEVKDEKSFIEDVGIEDKESIEEQEVENKGKAEYIEIEQVDAPYEHWLAATVITSISMDYLDFELKEVYAVGKTNMDNYLESSGVYVTFTSEDALRCIYSKPISEQRQEPGTFDIFAEYVGYATYDEISVEEFDLEAVKVLQIEDLNLLIEQLERVTKYMN